jgi:hypothetical protein
MNSNKKIILSLTIASVFFSEKGSAMNNPLHEEEKNNTKKFAILKPYHPSFSIDRISEKYTEKDMIGYYRKTSPVKKDSFIKNGLSFLKKIFKK